MESKTWLSDVYEAIIDLGGKSHYDQIYLKTREIRFKRNANWPESAKAIIRRTLEEQSSDSISFKGNDLFYSVEGIGKGVWGVRESVSDDIKSVLLKIACEYQPAKQENFTQHPLASFVRKDAKEFFQNTLNLKENAIVVKSSVGQSGWSDIPWIAFMHELVTKTTQRGYYPVYLFSGDGKSIYLCMGQGVDSVQKEFGKSWKAILHQRANLIKTRIPEYASHFYDDRIDTAGESSLSKSYEEAPAFHVKYDVANMPNKEKLISDLKYMINLYEKLILLGGTDLVETDDDIEITIDLTVTEKKKFRLHKKVEGRINTDKVKKILGFSCQACDLNFVEKYGDIGQNFIEAHHLIPYSELNEGELRTLDIKKDFAVLCANCHRMIHRMKSPSDVKGLRMLLETQKAKINKLSN